MNRLLAWVPESWRRATNDVLDWPHRDFVLRATVLLLMFYATRTHELRMVLRVSGCAMLFSTTLLYSRMAWLLTFTLCAGTIAVGWYEADNHYWLIGYWTLACAIAASESERIGAAILRLNGRLLIGLCFLFATVWKILGGQYHDGAFFVFQFDFDDRFKPWVVGLFGQPPETYDLNAKQFSLTTADPALGTRFPVSHTPAMVWAALAFGWWTILIEGAIALSFLSSRPRWLFERRDWVLLLFIYTTYLLTPVFGFGAVLITMGLAQCDLARRGTRVAYLASLIALHLGNTFAKFAVDTFVD